MRTRYKNGRVVAVSAPSPRAHGRLAAVAPAARTAVLPSDAAERYAFALVERHVSKALGDTKEHRRAVLRADRARATLVSLTGGAEEAKRIAAALTSSGGGVLRTVAKAHVETREFAARAAVRLTALVREHDVTSTAALVLLSSAAQWLSLSELLRERVFATDPAALSATVSRRSEDASVSKSAGELLKLASAAGTTGRLDLLSGLQVEQQSREHGSARGLDPAVEQRMADVIAGRRARDALSNTNPGSGPAGLSKTNPGSGPADEEAEPPTEPVEAPEPLREVSVEEGRALRSRADLAAPRPFTADAPPDLDAMREHLRGLVATFERESDIIVRMRLQREIQALQQEIAGGAAPVRPPPMPMANEDEVRAAGEAAHRRYVAEIEANRRRAVGR